MATQMYRLRGFNRLNPRDIELVNLMYFHPAVMKAKGYWQPGFKFAQEVDLTHADPVLFNAPSRISRKMENLLFAVADSRDKLVGWIWFYRDARHPLPQRIAHELGLTPRNSRIYQISYEKLMSEGWPSALLNQTEYTTVHYLHKPRRGVIVEGLRLAIARLRRSYRKLYARPRRLVLYGFTSPGNIASEKVLSYNGFKKQARKYSYEGNPHNLWVKIA